MYYYKIKNNENEDHHYCFPILFDCTLSSQASSRDIRGIPISHQSDGHPILLATGHRQNKPPLFLPNDYRLILRDSIIPSKQPRVVGHLCLRDYVSSLDQIVRSTHVMSFSRL